VEKVQDQMENQQVVEQMGQEKVQHLLHLYPYRTEANMQGIPELLEEFLPTNHFP
jgi:hypothetical protein